MSQASDQSQEDRLSEVLEQISHLKDKVTYLESRVSDLQQQKVAHERYAAWHTSERTHGTHTLRS